MLLNKADLATDLAAQRDEVARMRPGLPVLMKSPADKAAVYTAAAVVAAIVLDVVIGAITNRILLATMASPAVPYAIPG